MKPLLVIPLESGYLLIPVNEILAQAEPLLAAYAAVELGSKYSYSDASVLAIVAKYFTPLPETEPLMVGGK